MVIGNEPKSTQPIICGTAHGQMTFVCREKNYSIFCAQFQLKQHAKNTKEFFRFFFFGRAIIPFISDKMC